MITVPQESIWVPTSLIFDKDFPSTLLCTFLQLWTIAHHVKNPKEISLAEISELTGHSNNVLYGHMAALRDRDALRWQSAGGGKIILSFDGCRYEKEMESHNLETMDYAKYLRSQHWIAFRQKALEYYGKKCVICLSDKQPIVHHRTYENRGYEKMEDVVILCKKCHAKLHGKR